MKITGWEKLNGITYKGYCITNPIHNAIYTQYIADIMDISTKAKMVLRLDMEAGFDNKTCMLKLEDTKNKVFVNRVLKLEMLESISNFRMMYEMCIEDYINEVEMTWTNQYGTSNIVEAQTAQLPKSSSVLPSFDDFVKIWRTTPVGQLTQTLINK